MSNLVYNYVYILFDKTPVTIISRQFVSAKFFQGGNPKPNIGSGQSGKNSQPFRISLPFQNLELLLLLQFLVKGGIERLVLEISMLFHELHELLYVRIIPYLEILLDLSWWGRLCGHALPWAWTYHSLPCRICCFSIWKIAFSSMKRCFSIFRLNWLNDSAILLFVLIYRKIDLFKHLAYPLMLRNHDFCQRNIHRNQECRAI